MQHRFPSAQVFLTIMGFTFMLAYLFVALGGLDPITPQLRVACWVVVILTQFVTASSLLSGLYDGGILQRDPRAKHIFGS